MSRVVDIGYVLMENNGYTLSVVIDNSDGLSLRMTDQHGDITELQFRDALVPQRLMLAIAFWAAEEFMPPANHGG
jgi:hypothetical protein